MACKKWLIDNSKKFIDVLIKIKFTDFLFKIPNKIYLYLYIPQSEKVGTMYSDIVFPPERDIPASDTCRHCSIITSPPVGNCKHLIIKKTTCITFQLANIFFKLKIYQAKSQTKWKRIMYQSFGLNFR